MALCNKLKKKELCCELPEFLRLVQQSNKSLPPEILPQLFDCTKKEDPNIALIKAVVGRSGNWLIHQNPKWKDKFIDPTSLHNT